MTDLNYTAICLLVDRSGSMSAIQQEAESAINAFVVDQANEPGRRTVRLSMFDSGPSPVPELVYPSTPASDAPPFTLTPRGMTALLDAMYREIESFGAELAALPEDRRPGHVIFAVMTDGQENASRQYTLDQVKAAVQHQQDAYGWHVLYLGANQDAIAVAGSMGIGAGQTLDWAATGSGVRGATRSASNYVATASAGGPAEFTDADRERASK